MQTMYPAINNSPITELTSAISSTDTEIEVLNGDALPPAPNIAVLGRGEVSEVILYLEKDGNVLSEITRGFDNTTARAWGINSNVARNFTKYDYDAFVANIEAAHGHMENETVHVTTANKNSWNAKAEKSDIDNAKKFILTEGDAPDFEVTVETTATDYYRGMPVPIELHEDAGTDPTISVNGWSAKPMNGVKKAGFYTLVYDGSAFQSASGKGGESKLNVYTDADEPESNVFEGVKIGTSEAVNNVVISSDFVSAGTVEVVTMSNFPASLSGSYLWSTIFFDENLYAMGYVGSAAAFYRYNKDTDSWTTLAAPGFGAGEKYIMFEFEGELYALRNLGSGTVIKSYNKTTNAWSNAITLAGAGFGNLHCIIGRRIYFVSYVSSSGTGSTSFKYYDFDTNSETSLANFPFSPLQGIMYAKGNEIKVRFADRSSNVYYATYNIVNNTWSNGAEVSGAKLAEVNFGLVEVGSKQIFLEAGTTYETIVIYDTVTETTEKVTTDVANSNTLYIMQVDDNDIRLLNTGGTAKRRFWLEDSEEFEPNTAVIVRQSDIWGKYATELVTVEGLQGRNTTMFDDVLFCDSDGILQKQLDLEYGNGSSWIPLR